VPDQKPDASVMANRITCTALTEKGFSDVHCVSAQMMNEDSLEEEIKGSLQSIAFASPTVQNVDALSVELSMLESKPQRILEVTFPNDNHIIRIAVCLPYGYQVS